MRKYSWKRVVVMSIVHNMKRAYLILDNGRSFPGFRFGADTAASGELVFTTTGSYMESLIDPNYSGQILVQCFPQVGIYGIDEKSFEEKCYLSAYVVREWCQYPSNYNSIHTIDEYLKRHNIPGMCAIDTRALAKEIRNNNGVRAMISDVFPAGFNATIVDPQMLITSSWEHLSPYTEKKYKVTIINCGIKQDVLDALRYKGCEIVLVPSNTTAETILNTNSDGILISDGPGDPRNQTSVISEIRKLLGVRPMFGIGFGHQLMALAAGGSCTRLASSHRGANHPIRSVDNNRIYITRQNHGYVVRHDVLPEGGRVTLVNLNVRSCEGMDYPSLKAYSVQFVPTAGGGPNDTSYLYDKFFQLMEGVNNAVE